MGQIGNLVTTNCGRIVTAAGIQVEVLSPAISGHRANIVVAYFYEEGKKVSLSYFVDGQSQGHEVYKFHQADSLQHYWSKSYRTKLPERYKVMGERLKQAHREVFGY